MKEKNIKACLLLTFVLFICYSNSFLVPWHFDDRPNIVENQLIHLQDLSLNSIKKAAFLDNNRFKRPLAYLSFGLNWYFGQENVFGYHLVNFFIHAVTGIVLFFTILTLFQTPRLRLIKKQDVYFIALLSASLWAIHPIQVQAVTYIVQRMASMAAMFYIAGMYFYLNGRLEGKLFIKLLFFIGTCICFILAISSKQNTVLFPFSLILLELLFFQSFQFSKIHKYITFFFVSLFLIGFIGIYLFLEGNPLNVLEGYEKRGFTLIERLLTEPRILIFYLSQLFYPVVSRLSITHDFQISKSLFDPWTTWAAILFIVFLLGLAIHQSRKRPILSFAIFFFFVNHLIESTTLPLELVFEHRNYLPSLFIFLPVAVGIKYVLDSYQYTKKSMYLFISASLACVLIVMGIGTYTRNLTWASEKSLWQDAMEKAPQSARPRQNLGNYYIKNKKLKFGYTLNKQALLLYDSSPDKSKGLSYYNMGTIHLKRKQYPAAITYFKKAINFRPDYSKAHFALAIAYLQTNRICNAEAIIDNRLATNSEKQFIYLKSLIAIKNQKFSEAINYCSQVLRQFPHDVKSLLYLGIANMHVNEYSKANLFFHLARQQKPNDLSLLLAQIENCLSAHYFEQSQKLFNVLFAKYSFDYIKKTIQSLAEDPMTEPLTLDHTVKALSNKLLLLSISID